MRLAVSRKPHMRFVLRRSFDEHGEQSLVRIAVRLDAALVDLAVFIHRLHGVGVARDHPAGRLVLDLIRLQNEFLMK